MKLRHPDKEIQAAVEHALDKGWSLIKGRGHAWGMLRCPHNDTDCRCGEFCQMSVWSTPKNPGRFARQILQKIDDCIYDETVAQLGKMNDEEK